MNAKKLFPSILTLLIAQSVSAGQVGSFTGTADAVEAAPGGAFAYQDDLARPKELLVREILQKAARRIGTRSALNGTAHDKSAQNRILLEFLYAHKNDGPVRGEPAYKFDTIDAIWALGEVGDGNTAKYLEQMQKNADSTEKVNIAAALNKLKADTLSVIPVDGIKTGDILFRKGYFGMLNSAIGVKQVGHAGVVVGEENGELMVVEGWAPVKKTNFIGFVKDWPYYGNRTTSPAPNAEQRKKIADYAIAQLGKPYSMSHIHQKGPEKFDCVGLAEAAYEHVGLNPTPDSFEFGLGWPLTPMEQYEHTFPGK